YYHLWPQVVDILAEHLNAETISRWFESIIHVEKDQDTVFITVYSELQADWMDNHYTPLIKDSIIKLTGEEVQISFIINNPDLDEEIADKTSALNAPAYRPSLREAGYSNSTSRFNPRYNFESFVVGSGNRFAHAAALAVADRPAQSYNPLFLYGPSGMGKTHLMHAIGHRVKMLRPNTNVVYISTETFTNEFISAVRQGSAYKFKNRYRTSDIFLVDDIQFLTGKEGTQEEFFHTFNALYEQGKQIVISSDRHPKDISTLEERLRSRFEGGLITDIQPPDLETRIAILQYKANQENIKIMDDAIYYIATNIPSNIRELEGALNRVHYYSNITNAPFISLEMTQEALKGTLPNSQKQVITIDFIKQNVANYFHIKTSDMDSPRRDQAITRPRHIAMYLCQELLGASLSDIGRDFGNRDHTTVLHGCKKVQQDIIKDQNIAKIVLSITQQINQ
ncbi:MAG: chromosomal replication initiator protein DnaA, partial [Clostridia bacterium]|nr:chromosomal replication initiator protein DnaA [Clostridia bacterium]